VLIAASSRADAVIPRLKNVWPGFWRTPHPFLLYSDSSAVLVSSEIPSGDWAPLGPRRVPPLRQGDAYARSGPLPGLSGNFDMDYETGGLHVEAVAWQDGGPSTLETLFHEWFHVFQGRRFAATRGAGTLSPLEESYLDPSSYLTPRFQAMGEVERRMLLAALELRDRDSLPTLLRAYLAVRHERMRTASPAVRSAEINIERKEGSAALVGSEATSLAMGDSAGAWLEGQIQGLLSMSLDSLSEAMGSEYARFRFRLYGTGAAIGHLLDRLGQPWRKRLEAGASFDRLLAAAVHFDSGQAAQLAGSALSHYGFSDEIAARAARSASGPGLDPMAAFEASGRVRLNLTLRFPSPQIAARLHLKVSGGSPAPVGDGLILLQNVAELDVSAPGLDLTGEGVPVLLDSTILPDSIRLTLKLPVVPTANGKPLASGRQVWGQGVQMSTSSMKLRANVPIVTEVAGDSVYVHAVASSDSL